MAVYRSVRCETMDELRDLSVQAERVYLRLALGRFSTRTALIKYNARDLAAEARVRPSELEAALVELVGAGLLLRADNAPAVYLVGFCSAFAPRPVDNRRAWTADVDAFKYANLASQARKEIEDATGTAYPVATRRPSSAMPVPALQEQEQEQNKNTITPTASAPQAEPVELELKPQKVKVAKTKGPPRSHRAGDEIAAWWNGSLAQLGNAPCSGDRAWLVKYGKVAEAAAQAVGCLETIGLIMRWAYESDNYHAGRMTKGQRRTWRLEQWLAREHFEEMHAECVRARYLDDSFIDWSNRTIRELDHEEADLAEQDSGAKAAA